MPVFPQDRLTRPGMPGYQIGRGGLSVPQGTTRSSPYDSYGNWGTLSQNLSSERASEHLRPSDNPVYMDSCICQLPFVWEMHVLWRCRFMRYTAQCSRISQRMLPQREQCRSCCRFCRSAVICVASDGVAGPFKHRFSPTRFSREPLETITLYCPAGLVRGGAVLHVVLRLKLQMPDLTLSFVTNKVSHLDGAANQGPQIASKPRRAGTLPVD